jgi:hypothetical protein
MNARYRTALIAAMLLAPMFAAAQDTASAPPPRTAWGVPDLQGIWDYGTITPMVRPKEFGDRAFLTEEEAAALERQAIQREVDQDNAPARRAKAGENVGAYNHFWLDYGTKTVADRRTSLIVDPPNGRHPAMTPQAIELAKVTPAWGQEPPPDSYEQMSLFDRCLATTGHPIVPAPYNNNVQIVQTPDYVVLNIESNHTWRIIPLEGRPRVGIDQWVGESRGRWEGDTLVVETKNLHRELPIIGTSRHVERLIERFTRVSADAIRYEVTVEDPWKWVRPWTAAISLRPTNGLIYEYACHEGNHAVVNILRGARAQETAAQSKTSGPRNEN